MANQERMTAARRISLTHFVTVRLPSTAVRASNERVSVGWPKNTDGRSGVDGTHTEREPARINAPRVVRRSSRAAADPKCLRPPKRFVKGNEGPFEGAL